PSICARPAIVSLLTRSLRTAALLLVQPAAYPRSHFPRTPHGTAPTTITPHRSDATARRIKFHLSSVTIASLTGRSGCSVRTRSGRATGRHAPKKSLCGSLTPATLPLASGRQHLFV